MIESTKAGPSSQTVLIVDEDRAVSKAVGGTLSRTGCRVLQAGSLRQAAELLRHESVQTVIAAPTMPGCDSFELLKYVKANHPDVAVTFMSADGAVSIGVGARGVSAARFAVRAAGTPDEPPADRIVGQDYRMMKVFELIDAVADSRATVMITGESGTGKSLVARAIHHRSRRRNKPFVEVSCGALPETLLESELFGHVKGAFTDASCDREGKFAAADGGTIFLDEISAASPILQLKLLRVLQERTFEPVGSNRTRTVDVRVIVASNRDLWTEVEADRFRRDLYYRVNVVNVDLPPLRERVGDIVLLAEHFLGRCCRENSKTVLGFTDGCLVALQSYAWPGNIRELANCIERAVVLCRGSRIGVADLPATLAAAVCPAITPTPDGSLGGAPRAGAMSSKGAVPHQRLSEALAEPEKQIIRAALAQHGGVRQATARALGISRCTLYKKMKKYGLLQKAQHSVNLESEGGTCL